MLCLAAVALHAQSAGPEALLEQARHLAGQGKTAEAAGAYRQWLGAAPPSERYAEVLREAVDSQCSALAVLGLLAEFTPRVPDGPRREELQSERVELLRLLGRFDEALGAARQLPDSTRRLYLEALLFYEQGMFSESTEAARLALGRSPPPEDLPAARLRHVLGRALLASGQAVDAEAVLRSALGEHEDGPEAAALLLALVEALSACGRGEEAAAAAAELARRFPFSPEAALAPGKAATPASEAGARIRAAAAPQRLLGDLPRPAPEAPASDPAPAPAPALTPDAPAAVAAPAPAPAPAPTPDPAPAPDPALTPDAPAAVAAPAPPPAPEASAAASDAPLSSAQVLLQTGSFRDAENAEYMVRDLKARGFAAEVVTATVAGSLYYRVLVGPARSVAEAQGLLVRLKEAGFEGMLHFLP